MVSSFSSFVFFLFFLFFHAFPHLYNTKMFISKTKKDIPKIKALFLFTLKRLSNKQQLFLFHWHFKVYV